MKIPVIFKTARQRRLPFLTLLLAMVPLLAFTPRFDQGDRQVPFKGSFATTFESLLDFPFLHVSVTGAGQVCPLGKSTAVTTDEVVNLIDGSASASFTLTGPGGDIVELDTTFQVTQVEGGVTFTGTYTVTGGGGRFDGATGSGAVAGSATFQGPTNGIGTFSVDGTISSPRRN